MNRGTWNLKGNVYLPLVPYALTLNMSTQRHVTVCTCVFVYVWQHDSTYKQKGSEW